MCSLKIVLPSTKKNSALIYTACDTRFCSFILLLPSPKCDTSIVIIPFTKWACALIYKTSHKNIRFLFTKRDTMTIRFVLQNVKQEAAFVYYMLHTTLMISFINLFSLQSTHSCLQISVL